MTKEDKNWKKPRQKQYYLVHKEKILARQKQLRDQNKEKYLEYNRKYKRKWNKKHPGYSALMMRQWREKNKEKYKIRRRAYYLRTREVFLEKCKKRFWENREELLRQSRERYARRKIEILRKQREYVNNNKDKVRAGQRNNYAKRTAEFVKIRKLRHRKIFLENPDLYRDYYQKKHGEFKMNCKTYFIRCAEAIKIGRSTDPLRRFKDFQQILPFNLELLGILDGDLELELHDAFSQHHIKGEWFSYHPEIQTFIEEKCPAKLTINSI